MEIFLAIVVILVVVYFIHRAYSRACVDGNCPCPEEVTPVAPAPVVAKVVPTTTKKVAKKIVKKVVKKTL